VTPPKFTRIARTLRKYDTWAEKLLWSWLRDRRFSVYKFRRQHPYPPHVLDFFCYEAMLNIELDGSQHGTPGQSALDATRDEWLESRGIKCCGSGISVYEVKSKWFGMQFGGRCRIERHSPSRNIADGCDRTIDRVEAVTERPSPSPCPLPWGEGTTLATSPNSQLLQT